MKLILSTAVLASVFSPVVSFSYLDQLGGAPVAVAVAAPVPVAAAPVAAAAPAAVLAPVVLAADYVAPSVGNYMDSLTTGANAPTGSGIASYTALLPSNSAPSGAGLQTYTAALPTVNTVAGGAGMISHCDALGGNVAWTKGAAPRKPSAVSFSGSTSGQSVSFTLETSASLFQGISGTGTITLSGSIDSVQ
ncbi:hypothetical protein FRACYDRAFT_267641 [Fragilariopsis cylindrus CCMP1102]|uniref:Uncharacterized protein n=1 Tax=Fragilariopsis cylindrus CCMP1102 TaxID=635003 RepID=A0A1E7FRK3_9STRA|nr:hypothetical protein FRACYDRAFT_267641 [Fragilariopsis cylindrus CCMP1102]|eukprot:OEU20453.1 hypothetical protein FRACYDRAFT_267641 [Fragilariopsis cylindrus CCMP1102]